MSEAIRDGDYEYVPCGVGPKGETLYARRVWRLRSYPHSLPYTQEEIDRLGVDQKVQP